MMRNYAKHKKIFCIHKLLGVKASQRMVTKSRFPINNETPLGTISITKDLVLFQLDFLKLK